MLLTVEGLEVGFGAFSPVDDVAFSIDRGEILGIVGESGSGKSLTAIAIMGLLSRIGGRIVAGRICFDGIELAGLPEAKLRRLRGGRIALITQNPMTSLDGMMRVGPQIDQAARLHLGLDRRAARARSLELMADLRIPDPARVYDLYPHQLSGGMKQRIVIAMALAGDPELLVADEPTTALDVTVQAQIVQILVELVKRRGLAMILITHDMGVVAQTCDRVAVMYCGRVIERAQVNAIFEDPRHPYTQALIRCIPRRDMTRGSMQPIPGMVPNVANQPAGCRFNPRCPRVADICHTEIPGLRVSAGDHGVACLRADAA
ncbi:ABC transporter ATP-binding protein [Phyllobacterium myrsinacearum]|uniref:Oligopeptide/dipeptide ABC transporter ATP-binding protein n=1 Tax=Phyllobacterium myrsinacearum TaxID=28101 RepID=A0A839EX47_9HYPH|nr:ABC transporter ATP-binding protein [Phyllobacterium myrsinacearum]MBA8880967.1 oligopeptide/dipeptide ABC transporter ATP-binding protein [Phyllobacterium myrsinacearum]